MGLEKQTKTQNISDNSHNKQNKYQHITRILNRSH